MRRNKRLKRTKAERPKKGTEGYERDAVQMSEMKNKSLSVVLQVYSPGDNANHNSKHNVAGQAFHSDNKTG